MSARRFGRLLTAMVTPFGPDGSIDFDAAAALARFLVDQGNDGLVVAGSTGEGGALSDEEKLALCSCVSQAVTVPVLAGTSSSDTARSVSLTSQVEGTGVAGVLATTPAYARPSQRGIAAHLGAMAESTRLPIMLYDIPSRTGRKIAAATTIELARDHANVVALKDASGDLVGAAHLKAVLGGAFDLYSGDDALILPFMAVGGVGLVSVAGHWAAPEFAGIIASVEKDDWEQARVLNERVAESCGFESTEAYPNPMPAKAAMRALGMGVGQCRLPLGPGDTALDARAGDVLAALAAARA
jgi:4-hydroxy-tetrahydrodipicolinate synthase